MPGEEVGYTEEFMLVDPTTEGGVSQGGKEMKNWLTRQST
jgi:hypothetical protein